MSLAPVALVFWLDAGAAEGAIEVLVPQLRALALLATEMDARLAGTGLGGIAEAVALHERIRTVLNGVTPADLERLVRHVEDAKRALESIGERLAQVKALKQLLDGIEPPA